VPPTPGELLHSAEGEARQSTSATANALRQVEKRDREVVAAREDVAEAQEDLRKAEKRARDAREAFAEAQKSESAAKAALSGASSDEAIEELAMSRLAEDKVLNKGAVAISVNAGVAAVSGTVASAEAVERAIKTVGAVPGVSRVDSALEVAPVTVAP
jgi:osmotically-inducible protein OsmY